jgi:hypothetical protein
VIEMKMLLLRHASVRAPYRRRKAASKRQTRFYVFVGRQLTEAHAHFEKPSADESGCLVGAFKMGRLGIGTTAGLRSLSPGGGLNEVMPAPVTQALSLS